MSSIIENDNGSIISSENTDTSSNNSNKSNIKENEILGFTGLANMGNTCYINSAIQCLIHIPEFRTLCQKLFNNIRNKEGILLVELEKLASLMWSENCIVAPGAFIQTIQRIAKIKNRQIFTGYAQNDLPELLSFLFECFHNGIKREVIFRIKNDINGLTNIEKKCIEYHKMIYEKEYSEIYDMFFGIQLSSLYDMSMNYLDSTPEQYFTFHLPIPENNFLTLEDCIEEYFKMEKFDENTKYKKGDEYFLFQRKYRLWNVPKILILCLNRFQMTTRLTKNRKAIEIPNEINLSKYLIHSNKNIKYEFLSSCNHSGNIFGGHYTSTIKMDDGNLYEFNDQLIQRIKNNNVDARKAYCLFYRLKT